MSFNHTRLQRVAGQKKIMKYLNTRESWDVVRYHVYFFHWACNSWTKNNVWTQLCCHWPEALNPHGVFMLAVMSYQQCNLLSPHYPSYCSELSVITLPWPQLEVREWSALHFNQQCHWGNALWFVLPKPEDHQRMVGKTCLQCGLYFCPNKNVQAYVNSCNKQPHDPSNNCPVMHNVCPSCILTQRSIVESWEILM